MKGVRALLARLDHYQQTHGWLAFPLAVAKKFSSDNAGNLATVIAWSALAAVFPLLLLLITILGIVLRGNPSAQHHIVNSALVEFPVIGQQLQANINSLNRSGVGLVVGLIGTFLGTRGVANALQYALNTAWEVPLNRRPAFPWNALRSLAVVVVLGVGLIASATLSGVGGGTGALGAGVRVGAVAIAFVLNVAMFSVVFRLATADVAWRDLWLGALVTAAGWEVLLTVGGYLVSHDVRNMSAVYGTFALVLGLMSWLYLQAELMLYAVEIDVVRVRRLWPQSIVGTQAVGGKADGSQTQELGEHDQRSGAH
ncbi:MAG TPA: YihY/virulence factor BrkB family protein [Acidothermaceae bacterium]|nr:YihY/virulence factor BrkB family protein [Acidothermaceae bacterium]